MTQSKVTRWVVGGFALCLFAVLGLSIGGCGSNTPANSGAASAKNDCHCNPGCQCGDHCQCATSGKKCSDGCTCATKAAAKSDDCCSTGKCKCSPKCTCGDNCTCGTDGKVCNEGCKCAKKKGSCCSDKSNRVPRCFNVGPNGAGIPAVDGVASKEKSYPCCGCGAGCTCGDHCKCAETGKKCNDNCTCPGSGK